MASITDPSPSFHSFPHLNINLRGTPWDISPTSPHQLHLQTDTLRGTPIGHLASIISPATPADGHTQGYPMGHLVSITSPATPTDRHPEGRSTAGTIGERLDVLLRDMPALAASYLVFLEPKKLSKLELCWCDTNAPHHFDRNGCRMLNLTFDL